MVGETAGSDANTVEEDTQTNALVKEWKKVGQELRPALPGLYLVAGVAIVARFVHGLIPSPLMAKTVSEVLIAVILGLHVRSFIGFSARFDPGVKFALVRILRLGIILLGLRLSLQDVVGTGLSALLLILACITLALGLGLAAGRIFNIPARLAMLIGVGTAICGNSAIIATAPVIEAKDEDVSFAVATITLFGTLAIIVYPFVGHFLGLGDRLFGMWSGTAVNDTSQVVATAAAYSPAALDVATVVKLTRNTLMAPIIIIMGIFYARATQHELTGKAAAATKFSLGKLVPWFVLGFVGMALLRTLGVALDVLPQNVSKPGDLKAAAAFLGFMDEIAKFAILMALSAIGLGTSIESMRRTGLKPFAVGLLVALAVATFSLGVILLTGMA